MPAETQRGPLKGRITLVNTGEFVPFMFNPTEVQSTRSVPYPTAGVPGVSHPLPQYTGGGDELPSLELWLDGERGASIRRRRAENSLRPALNPTRDISVQHEIDWYWSLTFGERQGSVFSSVAPSIVLLTYGTMFRGLPCVVTDVSVRVSWFRPEDMAPVRATVSLKFKRHVREGLYRSDVYVGVGRAGA